MLALLLAAGLAGCIRPHWRQQLQSEDPVRRIDGAITAGKTRDRSAVPLLVERLEDDDEAVRMYAILALQRIEGTTLGYKYWADPIDLAHMAQRWRNHIRNQHQRAAATSQPASPQQPAVHDTRNDAALSIDPPHSMERIPSTQPLAQEASR